MRLMNKVVGLALALVFAGGLSASGSSQPSFYASLGCEPSFGGAICEASPFSVQGDYNYAWVATGALAIPAGCYGSPMCNVNCQYGGGTLTVVVTDTQTGESDSASKLIRACRHGGVPR